MKQCLMEIWTEPRLTVGGNVVRGSTLSVSKSVVEGRGGAVNEGS